MCVAYRISAASLFAVDLAMPDTRWPMIVDAYLEHQGIDIVHHRQFFDTHWFTPQEGTWT